MCRAPLSLSTTPCRVFVSNRSPATYAVCNAFENRRLPGSEGVCIISSLCCQFPHAFDPFGPDCCGRSAGDVKLRLIQGLNRCRKEIDVVRVGMGNGGSKSSVTGSKSYFEGVTTRLGKLLFSASTLMILVFVLR